MSYKDLIPGGSSSGLDPFRNPALAATRELEDKLAACYRERDFVVAALTRCFQQLCREYDGIAARSPAWLGWSESFDPDWRWCVYLDLPTGQVSWHIRTDELPLFDWVPRVPGDVRYQWDGHDTTEKYRRIYEYVTGEKE